MGVARSNGSSEGDRFMSAAVEVRADYHYDERPSGAHPVARECDLVSDAPSSVGLPSSEHRARSASWDGFERLGEQLRTGLSQHAAVLLQGERGVGKRYSIRTLHQSGVLAEFGTLTDVTDSESLERELSAWASGASAEAQRTTSSSTSGFWRKAVPGTLVVHEVARLSPPGQARLHDALRQFAALVPGLHPRFIVTSSDDLDRAVISGGVLPELFALLRPSRVWLAPLRARRHEIEPLVRRFFDTAKGRTGNAHPVSLCPSALARLAGYDWPGNVAELEEVIDKAVRRCTTPTLGLDDLCAVEPQLASSPLVPTILPPAGVDLRQAVESFENSLIHQALARTRWNKNQAAKLLGLNRTTLVEMLKRKGIREG